MTMRSHRSLRLLVPFVSFAAAAVACNAILGTPDPVLRADAGVASDATTSDAGDACGSDCGVDASVPEDARADTPVDAPVDACSLNLQTDKDNCGACGHSCLGGACDGGACQPLLLWSEFGRPNAVAVDPGSTGSVYWCDYDTDGVYAMDKRTLVTTTIQQGDFSALAAGMAVARTAGGPTVFWTNPVPTRGDGTISWANADGGQPGNIYGATWDNPTPIASDGPRVFWGNRNSHEVWSMDVATKTPRRIAGYSSASVDLIFVGAEPGLSGFVFYSDGRTIFRVPKDGGAAAPFDGPSLVTSSGPFVITDDGFVYWVAGPDASPSIVRKRTADGTCPVAACPQSIVPGGTLKSVTDIAADDTFLYIADNSSGRLFRSRKDGSSLGLEVVATRATMAKVAVDTVAIYYAVQIDAELDGGPSRGSLWRLAK